MQLLSIVSLFSALSILFKHHTKRIYEIGLDLLSNTTNAKLGKLEVIMSKELENLSNKVVEKAAWIQILLSKMTNDEFGLLLSISKVDGFQATEALKPNLRLLRSKGLIHHDQPTMANSSEVWISELGKEFVLALNKAEVLGQSEKNY